MPCTLEQTSGRLRGMLVVVVLLTCLSTSCLYWVSTCTGNVETNATSPATKKNATSPLQQGLSNTMNILDGKMYPHHPVMLQIPIEAYSMEEQFLVELNGLKVPAKYDCDMFNKGQHWGTFPYFYEVPSRWHACWQHYAAVQSGLVSEVPLLPYIDDEYNEQVAVYQSVLRAPYDQVYVMAELGARWGTWSSRAVAFLRRIRPQALYDLYVVEASSEHCEGVRTVMKKNAITHKLDCGFASKDGLRAWASAVNHIDLVDFDIQKAEGELIPKLIELLNTKAYRLIVGTHSPEIHDNLRRLFAQHDWVSIWDVPPQSKNGASCVDKYMRGWHGDKGTLISRKGVYMNDQKHNVDISKRAIRFNWGLLLKEGCFHSTPRGPVAHYDGQLIVDNRKFVNIEHKFSMHDHILQVHDLHLGSSNSA